MVHAQPIKHVQIQRNPPERASHTPEGLYRIATGENKQGAQHVFKSLVEDAQPSELDALSHHNQAMKQTVKGVVATCAGKTGGGGLRAINKEAYPLLTAQIAIQTLLNARSQRQDRSIFCARFPRVECSCD